VHVAALDDDGRFERSEQEDPTPGPRDLVLRVTGCGICGSDLKARSGLPSGTVMGHEFCGEVVAVGTDATDTWREGVHAAVLPVFSCGACDRCRAGFVALCSAAALVGLGGAPGGFGELARVGADLAFPLPEAVPPAWGPLVEPFAVGLHTARLADIQADDRVLVIGGGPVGLTTAAWARRLGASDITLSDPVAVRRDAGADFGVTNVVDPTHDDLGGPYDVAFECVGTPGLLDVAANAVDVHGRIVVAGVCAEPDPFLPLVPLLKELTIRFSVYYRPAEFRAVIDAFADGSIDPSTLVTRTVGFAELDEVFTTLASSPDELKVVVDPAR
jgi:(R,R)-butanediol dehydrogenase / meso-butanediol dehydrogenase / diacetyl reductase